MGNAHTEEEFKTLLKNLFAEKKRVKALKKELDLKKSFQTKLSDIQKLSVTEEFAHLKHAYDEKEKELQQLRQQLEKVKPLLKKLVHDLKEAKADDSKNVLLNQEIEKLKHDVWAKEGELTRLLEQQKREGEERQALLEKVAESKGRSEKHEEKIATLQETCEKLSQQFERKIYEAKEKQTALEEELEEKKHKLRHLDERWHEERKAFALQREEWETKEKLLEKLHADLEEAHERLKESDVAAVHEEYSAHIAELEERYGEGERRHQELLEKGYHQMRALSTQNGDLIEEREKLKSEVGELRVQVEGAAQIKEQLTALEGGYEERGEEIRRAQQHLAKKVKESTILRDLVERQKLQMEESKEELQRQKLESERLENNLRLQKLHEEKLEQVAKERAEVAERAAKEWQEKYLALQEETAVQKRTIEELEKMKEEYSHLASTVSSLKSVLKEN